MCSKLTVSYQFILSFHELIQKNIPLVIFIPLEGLGRILQVWQEKCLSIIDTTMGKRDEEDWLIYTSSTQVYVWFTWLEVEEIHRPDQKNFFPKRSASQYKSTTRNNLISMIMQRGERRVCIYLHPYKWQCTLCKLHFKSFQL